MTFAIKLSGNFSLLGFLFLLAVPSVSHSQEWARKMFKETSHDYGDVLKGELPEHRFEIENIYQEDLVIQQVTTSCPCIMASLEGGKNVLKTWEKAYVVCKFNSPAFDGHRKATVTVRFARPYAGEVQLNLAGNIVRGVNFSPTSIEFGQISESNLPTRTVQISSSGNPNFRVVDVKSTFSHVGVQLNETVRNGNLVKYDMFVRLKPTVPSGFNQGELHVVVQENNITRQIPIKFSAKLVSALQLPESISIGPISQGEEISRKVILRSEQEFRVTDVTCVNTAYRAKTLSSEPKKVQFVEVIYTASQPPGHHEDELIFFIDDLPDPAGKMKVYVDIAEPE